METRRMPVKTSPTIPHYSTRRSSPFALPKKKGGQAHASRPRRMRQKHQPQVRVLSVEMAAAAAVAGEEKKTGFRSCVSTATCMRTPEELRMSDRRCGCSLGPTSDVRRENTLSACPVYLST
jgi:hypothetical protein